MTDTQTDMQKQDTEEITFEQAFHHLNKLLREHLSCDAWLLGVYDRTHERYTIINDRQYREFDVLPQSVLKEVLDTQTPKRMIDPKSDALFDADIDVASDKDAGALLAFPAQNDALRIAVVMWNRYERAKDQVLQPLVVGNRTVGMTTTVKNTHQYKAFEAEDIQVLKRIKEVILDDAAKLVAQIEKQKEALLNDIQTRDDLFGTPQEIIASLINMLSGLNTSVLTMKDLVTRLRKQIRNDDKLSGYITSLEHVVDAVENNLLHAFRFTSTNDIVKALLGQKETVETASYFAYFFTYKKAYACQKKLSVNLFIDPRMPAKVMLDKRRVYTFMTSLMDTLYEKADEQTPFYIFAYKHPKSNHLRCKVLFYNRTESASAFYDFFVHDRNDANATPAQHYTDFRKSGGDAVIDFDERKGLVTCKVSFPYDEFDRTSIGPYLGDKSLSIGFLWSRELDADTANNITRYLMAMGVDKASIKASEQTSIVRRSLTHLIVFESRLKELTQQENLAETDCRILLVTDGCLQKGETSFYDYSVIDMEIEKNSFYLDDLVEFLTTEV